MNLKEIRKYRIFGIALFDLITAFIGLAIIFIIAKAVWFPRLRYTNFVIACILLAIPLGIFFHVVLGINTTLNHRLGLSYEPKS